MSESAILPAPTILPAAEDSLCDGRITFHRLLPDLLKSLEGRFVAIHGGEVVATGGSFVETAQSAYGKVGYVPIFVAQVTATQPPLFGSGHRVFRPEKLLDPIQL